MVSWDMEWSLQSILYLIVIWFYRFNHIFEPQKHACNDTKYFGCLEEISSYLRKPQISQGSDTDLGLPKGSTRSARSCPTSHCWTSDERLMANSSFYDRIVSQFCSPWEPWEKVRHVAFVAGGSSRLVWPDMDHKVGPSVPHGHPQTTRAES